jgi:predicted amidophosphoribosyltransferase
MECLLICTNPKCRYLISLREGTEVLVRSKLILDECPDCGQPWSSYCPFCARPLETNLREIPHVCSHCSRALRPEIP